MLAVLTFFIITLSVLGWMLHINAQDRKRLEKELDQEFGEGPRPW